MKFYINIDSPTTNPNLAHNPRQSKNPKFDDIKESIRIRGLDHPPVITRRPGEQHYIIRSGGNTRLTVLKELYEETQDQRFFMPI